jgi:hypothetical protein
MTHPKPIPLSSQTLGKRGPRSLDELTALRGKRPMTHSKLASSSSLTLRRRGPRSLDDLVALHGERPMTHPKPTPSRSQTLGVSLTDTLGTTSDQHRDAK